jgi:4-hydroxybenzoate polyprenyltransferase
MAIPRGFLLPVAGWSTVKSIATREPWLMCTAFGLFILGAGTTKDFADIAGDRAGGCRTLPVVYGIQKTALLIAPFFVLPFLLWGVLARMGKLSAHPTGLYLLAGLLPLLGAYIDFRILRHPEELSKGENHVSWKLIYMMAMLAYIGMALAYLLPRS